ncbi:hypothetical protein LEN26_012439 [Aphanomyces euteiches]|nr:hypothetical protein LEN26_012439 [Aphanomyces euteiches]KAH9127657.1 hypothetical protein AeMF1_002077 [Aphanomyces euteiches]KAH9194856.1 hypothetical protein AeNC1_003159 [Aphanomyces euteiches]
MLALRRARHSSKTLLRALSTQPSDWEAIKRRNGQVVYFNRVTKESSLKNPFGNDDSPIHTTTTTTEVTTQAPSDENAVVEYNPIDFSKAAQIVGQESQIVHIALEPNQKLRAETGAMIYMTDGVQMDTHTAGGFQQGLKRMMTGENVFVTEYTYTGTSTGQVCLGTSVPSKIVHMKLDDFGGSLICQKGAFLAGSHTIGIEMEFTKNFGAGFFGGEGFILQRLTGPGEAFVRASGALIERTLQPGEVLRISSGCLVAFEPTVSYDIQRMQGVKNVLFSGEGLFVTTLTGPGRVFLQGMPFDRMVSEIASRVPGGGGGFMVVPPIGMGGGSSGGEAAAAAGAAGDVAAAEASGVDEVASEAPADDDKSLFGFDEGDANTMQNDPDPNSFVTEEDGDDLSEAADSVVDFLKKWF